MTNLSPALMRFGDVSVRLSVELGRTDLPLRDVLSLGQGSVVALNRLTDELLDITANGKVVAQGEVIAQDGKFALRIVNLIGDDPSSANAAPPMPMAPTRAQPSTGQAAMHEPAMRQSASPAAPASPMPNPAPAPASAQTAPPPPHAPSAEPAVEARDDASAPAPGSDAAPNGQADAAIDETLDSTLDELTDALDELGPSDSGEGAPGEEETG